MENYHEKYDFFYQSDEWRRTRARKFVAACGLCEKCRAKGVVRAGKEVHHIVPIEKDWSLRFAFDNLVLLCADCHNKIHERVSPLQKFNKLWEEIDHDGEKADDRSDEKTKSQQS